MEIFIVAVFILGYCAIAFEHFIKVNKAASALITGVLCWTVYILFSSDKVAVSGQLSDHMGQLSGILFFLLCAMTIVELIDAHNGFDIITGHIKQTNKRKLIWIIAFITFFLSAILDNLTTTIVIISLLRKLISEEKERLFFVGIVVVAANAGGAWTPIGDVTTTMLWIGNQISTMNVMLKIIIPCIISLLVPLVVVTFMISGEVQKEATHERKTRTALSEKHKIIVFTSGVLVLVLIPVFKTITHLPPYMGALIGLGILWIITEFLHSNRDVETKIKLSIAHALRKIDTTCILFFLGILISVASLESVGVLSDIAVWMTKTIANENIILLSIGVISSVIDNVPLVAAVQGMYSLSIYPTDHNFWIFLSYCAGNGGSILIIGSAAGVAAMGMEKIHFFWYLRKITFFALLGYFAGALTFILQQYLF